jgi:hypothetical protein
VTDIGLSGGPFLTFVEVVGKLKGPADQLVTGVVNLRFHTLRFSLLVVAQDTVG